MPPRLPPIAIAERAERRARWLMADCADTVANLAADIATHPERTRNLDIERLASVLVALGQRYGQWCILRAELKRLRAGDR